MNLLYPTYGKDAFLRQVCIALLGALMAAVYGVLHDQLTYTISHEYFTKFKYVQFGFLDLEAHPRLVVAKIGILATWWVGLIAGWLIGRMGASKNGNVVPLRLYMPPLLLLVGITAFAGITGYFYGILAFDLRHEQWSWAADAYEVDDLVSFARVGYVHNFGYLGAVAGAVAGMVWMRMRAASWRDSSGVV